MPRRLRRPFLPLVALCLALSSASAARASITPDAQAVIDRYVAAIGGRAVLDSTRTTHLFVTLEAFGFNGTAENWTEAPDREASDVTLGPFHVQDGFDGTTAWRVDPSGTLLTLDGKDLEEAKAGAWFSNDRWLEADQGGGRIARVGSERDSAGTYDVLEVTPPVGRPRKLYVDTRTGLLARWVAVRDMHTTMTENLEWAVWAGRRMPVRSRQSMVELPANTLLQRIDSVVVNAAVPAERFARPDERATPVRWLKQDGVARLPFQYQGRHVWLRARIGDGPPADFLFDTGASLTMLDSAYAASIGIHPVGTMSAQGAGASGRISFARLPSLRVEAPDGDGIELADPKVGVLALNSMLAPYFWRDCAGVIGFDFISRFVERIDYDAQVLTLRDPKTFRYEGTGARVPFRIAGYIPVVPMTIDGRYAGEFRLDVGSSSTVDLHTPFVKEHQLLQRAGRTLAATEGGFGGTFTSQLARIDSISLGPFTWKEPIVSLQTSETGMLASTDYAGNVGNQILDRFTVTFDYERRELWLEPGRQVAKRDAFSRLGALLVRMDGVIKVGQVLPGSAAERAGMQLMDEVIRIDGKPALEYGPDGVNRMFEERRAGSTSRFVVKRDGRLVKLKVKLRDLL